MMKNISYRIYVYIETVFKSFWNHKITIFFHYKREKIDEIVRKIISVLNGSHIKEKKITTCRLYCVLFLSEEERKKKYHILANFIHRINETKYKF